MIKYYTASFEQFLQCSRPSVGTSDDCALKNCSSLADR